MKSKLEFEGLNWKEITKYLAIKIDPKEAKENDIEKFLPTRYTDCGKKPTVKYLDSDTIRQKRINTKGDEEDGEDDGDADEDDEQQLPTRTSTPSKLSPQSQSPGLSPVRRRLRPRRTIVSNTTNSEQTSFQPPSPKIRRQSSPPSFPPPAATPPPCPPPGGSKQVRWDPRIPEECDVAHNFNLKEEKWNWNETVTQTKEELKKLLSLVYGEMIKSTFTNHFYRFNQKYFKQINKGPIGLKASGSITRLFLIWWDRMFLELASILGILIFMYTRYGDDGNLAVKAIPNNVEFDEDEKKLKVNVEHSDEASDVHTAKVLKDVANSITKMLVWEEDCPSKHKDGNMPILDLKVRTESTGQGGTRIKHQYYKKSMARKEIFPSRTALSTYAKYNVLVEEGKRSSEFQVQYLMSLHQIYLLKL